MIIGHVLTPNERQISHIRFRIVEEGVGCDKVQQVVIGSILPEVIGRIDVGDIVWSDRAGCGNRVRVDDLSAALCQNHWRHSQSKSLQRIRPQLVATEIVEGATHVSGDDNLLDDAREQDHGKRFRDLAGQSP